MSRLIPLLLAGLLAGCATLPERAPVADPQSAWRTRQAELKPLTAWEIHGRLALRTAEEGWQATLVWWRERDRHRIDLAGPLGGGRVRLTQDRGGAELRDAEQKVYRDTSVEQLLKRATGWHVPLEGLNYWVRGLPAPEAATHEDLDAWGRLKTLTQLGWDIQFLEYARHGARELPSKVFIRRQARVGERRVGDEGNDATVEVRLIIERWTLQ
jgi:outer membrane lipoprotein LolB